MSRPARKWILLCLALLLMASASYFEWHAIDAAFTAGDVAGPDVQQDQQAIRELEHQANIYTAEAVVCVVLASFSLGTAIRRGNWKHSVAAYIGAFLVCPTVSFLPIYIRIRLHM
ncbi:MAG: hypothetical protein ACRD3F_17005 [Acidobacteriaceae bacterium]